MTAWNDPPLSPLARFTINLIGCLFVPVCTVALMWLVGTAIETIGQHQEDRDRCLKRATNGYEIERCR